MENEPKEEINDFDIWNLRKQAIHARANIPTYDERDIWWCSVGQNIGSEENGKHENFERPVLIFRKFGDGVFWGIPITSASPRKISRTECLILFENGPRTVDIIQLRLMSGKRLLRFVEKMSLADFQHIRNIFGDLK